MKLGIVIPLKSKMASRNWDATTGALQFTIDSILNQTDDRYEVAVVGHEKPYFLSEQRLQSVRYTSLETPPPILSDASQFRRNKSPFILDKNQKIVRAMQVLRSTVPTHWFYLDADDLISRNFVHRILQTDCQRGAVIDGGYFLFRQQWRTMKTNEMSAYCGSTSVLPCSHIQIPKQLSRSELSSIPWCRYPHSRMHEYFRDMDKIDYTVIREPLIAYVIGHGDNCSDGYRQSWGARLKMTLKPWIKGSRINARFEREFGISNQKRRETGASN